MRLRRPRAPADGEDGQGSSLQPPATATGSLLGLPEELWIMYIVPMVAAGSEQYSYDAEEANLEFDPHTYPAPRINLLSVINLSMVCRQAHRMAHETLGLRGVMTIGNNNDDPHGGMDGGDHPEDEGSVGHLDSESYGPEDVEEAAAELDGLKQDLLLPRAGAMQLDGTEDDLHRLVSTQVRGMRAWHRVEYELRIPDPLHLDALLAALAHSDTGNSITGQLPAWGASVRKVVLGAGSFPLEPGFIDCQRDDAGHEWNVTAVRALARHFTSALRILDVQHRPPTVGTIQGLLARSRDQTLVEAFVRARPGLVKICYEVFGLHHKSPIRDSVLKAVGQTCPDLKALSMYLYDPMARRDDFRAGACTDKGLQMLASGCSKLKQLCLVYNPSITTAIALKQLPLEYVWMSGSLGLLNVSGLADVRELFLEDCRLLTDVSPLSRVHHLHLNYCNSLVDVSSLGQVYSLYLQGCVLLTDVSPLSRVHTLILDSCESVTDVSSLGAVKCLSLSYCQNVTDLSALGGVEDLCLFGCPNVTDVSALGRVRRLVLEECNKIADISKLGSVSDLRLPDHLAAAEWMRCIGTLASGHTGAVSRIVALAEWMITCSEDGLFKIWTQHDWTCIKTVAADQSDLWCMVECGGDLVTGSRDGSIKVWQQGTWTVVRTLEGHTDAVRDLVVHGNRLMSCSNDGTVRVWDSTSWQCERVVQTGHTGYAISLAAHDGMLYCGGDAVDSSIRVIDMSIWRSVGVMHGHTDVVWQMRVLGDRLISCSGDNTIKTWSMKGGRECEQTLEGHSQSVNTIALCGDKLVSGSDDSAIRLWGRADGPGGKWQCERVLRDKMGLYGGYVTVVTCTRDGKGVVSGTGPRGSHLQVWEVGTPKT